MVGYRVRSAQITFPAAVLLMAAVLGSCGGGGSSPAASSVPVRGVSLSPQGFPADYSRLPDFFTEIRGIGNAAVMWNGAWRDNGVSGVGSGTVPAAAALVADGAATYAYTPVTVFGWRSGTTLYVQVPSNPVNDWTNDNACSLYRSMLVSFVAARNPPYVFLGNENDFYFEQDNVDYANWLSCYNSAYDAIKAASPGTMAGPVFNFEHLAGSGALNGWTTSHWGALTGHDLGKVDVVGMTLYPFFQHDNAANVPATYMDNLFSRIGGKPVVVTETGWPAENLGGLNPPWSTSPAQQVEYVDRFAAMTAGKDVRLSNWTFLHQMQDDGSHSTEWKLFGSVSLRDNTAIARPAYAAWFTR